MDFLSVRDNVVIFAAEGTSLLASLSVSNSLCLCLSLSLSVSLSVSFSSLSLPHCVYYEDAMLSVWMWNPRSSSKGVGILGWLQWLMVALQGIKVLLLVYECPEWGMTADNPGRDMSPGCLMCWGGRIICLLQGWRWEGEGTCVFRQMVGNELCLLLISSFHWSKLWKK